MSKLIEMGKKYTSNGEPVTIRYVDGKDARFPVAGPCPGKYQAAESWRADEGGIVTIFYRALLLCTRIELALARSLPVRNMENIARLTRDEETYASALLRRRINE